MVVMYRLCSTSYCTKPLAHVFLVVWIVEFNVYGLDMVCLKGVYLTHHNGGKKTHVPFDDYGGVCPLATLDALHIPCFPLKKTYLLLKETHIIAYWKNLSREFISHSECPWEGVPRKPNCTGPFGLQYVNVNFIGW